MKACRMFILIWGIFVISPSRSILMKIMKYILSLTNRLFRLKAICYLYVKQSFEFGADIQEALKIEKHIDIDIVSHIDINSFGKTLANIFSNSGKP